jgi:hypothetical protein
LTAPKASRPVMPKGYGVPKIRAGMLEWGEVRTALEKSGRFWIATTNADGTPHLIQQWGAWVDDRFYWEGGSDTLWAKNLARQPRIVVSCDHGDMAVIVQGVARFRTKPDHALAEKVVRSYTARYKRKYDYAPKVTSWDDGGIYELTPVKVLAWVVARFGKSATRFTF